MELHVRFKNISDEVEREQLKEVATQKLEDLNRYFGKDTQEGELTGECTIEHTGKHPSYKVHVMIQHRDGKMQTFEATEESDHADAAINNARTTLKNQISREKD